MWISVDKRLPRNGVEKLVTVRDMYGKQRVTVASFFKGRWSHWLSGTVIAWANLPRAYRGKR